MDEFFKQFTKQKIRYAIYDLITEGTADMSSAKAYLNELESIAKSCDVNEDAYFNKTEGDCFPRERIPC